MELYNILIKFQFSTSKTKLDIPDSKLGTWVASQVAERLKTLKKFVSRKNLRTSVKGAS